MFRTVKQIIAVLILILLCSCSVIEKSSKHGFGSGYYTLKSPQNANEKVYVDIADEDVKVYHGNSGKPDTSSFMNFSLQYPGDIAHYPLLFRKRSVDIDLTTILLKYRPGVSGLPAQLNTDFNAALFAGWRQDNYHFHCKADPLGRFRHEMIQRGFDFGLVAGPATTLIGPFATNNVLNHEYVSMAFQFGLAGFVESNIASFGIAVGYDYLASPDRDIWIYNKKPWVGLIVGIALN
jgi:hypothetical protein